MDDFLKSEKILIVTLFVVKLTERDLDAAFGTVVIVSQPPTLSLWFSLAHVYILYNRDGAVDAWAHCKQGRVVS